MHSRRSTSSHPSLLKQATLWLLVLSHLLTSLAAAAAPVAFNLAAPATISAPNQPVAQGNATQPAIYLGVNANQSATNAHLGIVRPSQGIQSRGGLQGTMDTTTLVQTSLAGGSISISATGVPGKDAQGHPLPSGISLAGVNITTPGQLSLNAGTATIAFDVASTSASTSQTQQQRDLAYQTARGQGATTSQAQYNQLSYASLSLQAGTVTVQVASNSNPNTSTSGNTSASTGPLQTVNPGSTNNPSTHEQTLTQLAAQPGLAWVGDVMRQQQQAALANPQAALQLQNVQLASEQWDYRSQGLTPEGAAIISLVVAYFTAGAGTSLVGAGASGLGGAVLTGAVQAGVTTLATQASISLINNQGNLGATFNDLGSSASVRSLLSAMATGGVLAGLGNTLTMNVNGVPTPLNQISSAAGASPMQVLGRNLINTTSGALITTAIHGGNLGDNLTQAIATGFITTGAALSASAIGSGTAPGSFANFAGHAIAGCAAGTLQAGNSGGCGPAALGAVLGEATALMLNGNRSAQDILANGMAPGTNELAALMGGMGVAITGGNPQQIGLGGNAATNAAENNLAGQLQTLARAVQQLGQGGMQAVSSAGQAALLRCFATPWCASLPLVAGAMASMNNATQMAGNRPDGAALIPTGLSATTTPGTPGTPLPPPPPLGTPIAAPAGPNNTGGTQLDQPQGPTTTGGSLIEQSAPGSNLTTTPIVQPQGVGIVVSQGNPDPRLPIP